ncbi:helix-turn-helix domain-containing protein [Luteibacter aegosomatissinici]|uniref:helix-turn-helix domain-containing protein n=1 Tax=Luteibacter aegosomatissinici TaxID=2911539 RepID=UPI001FFB1D4C|nr:transcriptional regulator [Luteibacter aegosomatissinici]UPG92833.1 transcriptional regulator [Luteibacter aegosomatissinici]
MAFAAIIEKAHSLLDEAPFIGHISNQAEYEQALALVDELFADIEANEVLISVVATAIRRWEDEAEEFSAFNAGLAALDDVDVLRVLMEQHNLGVADLPEIGGKSLVSRILNRRERNLTKDHIIALSQRFDISPALFFS